MRTNSNSPTTAMHQAAAALARAGVHFLQPTGFQLKVGPYSFYPGKGTIYRDGDVRARPEKGLPAFLRLLRDEGHAGADATPVKPVDDPDSYMLELPDEDDEFATV